MRKCADYHYFKHTLKQAYSKGWIQCPRCGKLCKANPIGVQLMTIPCLSLTFVMIEPIMPTIKNMINKSTKEDIVDAVKDIQLDTIYFLSK